MCFSLQRSGAEERQKEEGAGERSSPIYVHPVCLIQEKEGKKRESIRIINLVTYMCLDLSEEKVLEKEKKMTLCLLPSPLH